MLKIRDMTAAERTDMMTKARTWYWNHIDHVDKLLQTTTSYAPSGSDIFRPELWKAAHWKWFFHEYKMGDSDAYRS